MIPLLWAALAPSDAPQDSIPAPQPEAREPTAVARAPQRPDLEPVPLARMSKPRKNWRSQDDEQVRANRASAERIRRLPDGEVAELARTGQQPQRLFALHTLWFRGRRDLAENAARGDPLLLGKLQALRSAAQ